MKRRILFIAVLFLYAVTLAAQDSRPAADFDVILRGGLIVDGSGAAGKAGDLGMKGDRIAALGDLSTKSASETIDVRGMIVTPGFIDLHSHSDDELLLPQTRANRSFLFQGVTTVVTGNCGMGHVEVAKYFAKAEKSGVGTNLLHLVPHGSIRERAMKGSFDRAPTADEIKEMKRLLTEGLDAGAIGLSTGLIYTPGSFSKTDELIELARILAERNALYASHIRGEGDHLIQAIGEALTIAKTTGCRAQISHLKCVGPANWGKVKEAASMIEAARKDGVRVTADQYPYTASSTSLAAMVIPEWARAGTKVDLLRRLDDPTDGKRIRDAIRQGFVERGGAGTIQIASFDADPTLNGKTIAEAAKTLGLDPVECAITLQKRGGASAVSFAMNEDDVRWVMQKDWVACASDGSSQVKDASRPHPRSYGTFPRRIGKYAIEEKTTSLEAAVRASSGLPAEILLFTDRGVLRPGAFADVTVFDPKTFRDRATFVDPHQEAGGVRFVLVNGRFAIKNGEATEVLAGRVLRR